MAQGTPLVENGTLRFLKDDQLYELKVDSQEWFSWLETVTTFAFKNQEGYLTLHKERSGGKQSSVLYWKAYRTHASQLYRLYLGKSEQLTLQALQQAVSEISRKITARGIPVDLASAVAAMPNEVAAPARPLAKTLTPESASPNNRVKPSKAPAPWVDRTLLLAGKFSPPALPAGYIQRDRLLARLDDYSKYKLILLWAGAGFGKTTLLLQWLNQFNLSDFNDNAALPPTRVAWFNLTASDSQPDTFFHYLIAALQTIRPDFGQRALGLLAASPTADQPELIMTAILAELKLFGSEPVVIILDDYHLFTPGESLKAALALLIEHLPAHMHLIISSRSEPGLPLSKLQLKSQLLSLDTADLRLTTSEVTLLVRHTLKLDLSSHQLNLLNFRSDGWAAGVQMIGTALKNVEPAEVTTFLKTFNGTVAPLWDYFSHEIFNQQDETIRQFLMVSSIAERLTVDLCIALLQPEHENLSNQVIYQRLQVVLKANLGLFPADHKGSKATKNSTQPWYRYHSLFREFLQAQLSQQFPALISGLHQRAADWFLKMNYREQALEHLLLAANFKPAATLMENLGWRYYFQGNFPLVINWLERLPLAVRKHYPVLNLLYGYILTANGQMLLAEGPLTLVRQWLETKSSPDIPSQANNNDPASSAGFGQLSRVIQEMEPYITRQFLPELDPILSTSGGFFKTLGHLLTSLKASQTTSLAMQSNDRATIEVARQTLQALQADYADLYPQIQYMLGVLYELTGQTSQAYPAYTEAYRQTHDQPNLAVTTQVSLIGRGNMLSLQGQLNQAAYSYQQVIQLATYASPVDGHEQVSPLGAIAYYRMSELLYEWNRLEEAQTYLETALELLPVWGNPQIPGYIYQSQALLFMARGQAEEARLALGRAERHFRDYYLTAPLKVLRLYYLWFELQTTVDGPARALILLENLDELEVTARTLPVLLQENYYLLLIKILLLYQYPEQALTLVEKVLPAAQQAGRTGQVIKLLILQASALAQSKLETKALTVVRQAVTLAYSSRYVRSFIDHQPVIVDLLARLLKEDQVLGETTGTTNSKSSYSLSYLKQLIKAGQTHPPKNTGVESSLQKLSKREKEVLDLLRTGLSNQLIAQKLGITERTAKAHVSSIMSKLGANSRKQAVMLAGI